MWNSDHFGTQKSEIGKISDRVFSKSQWESTRLGGGHSPFALYLLLLPSWDSKIKILHGKNIEISVKYSNLEICSFSGNGQKHAHNTKNGLDGFQIMLYVLCIYTFSLYQGPIKNRFKRIIKIFNSHFKTFQAENTMIFYGDMEACIRFHRSK